MSKPNATQIDISAKIAEHVANLSEMEQRYDAFPTYAELHPEICNLAAYAQLQGITPAKLSRHLGVTKGAVSRGINASGKNPERVNFLIKMFRGYKELLTIQNTDNG